MAENSFIYSEVPPGLLKLLTNHLPFSIPLLRRLQFTKFEGGLRATARVIFVSDGGGVGENSVFPKRFSAAYLDIGGGPETQMWVYSTLEDSQEHKHNADDIAVYETQLERLVEEAVSVSKGNGDRLSYPGAVLLGTLHDSVKDIMVKTGRVELRETGPYDKWLFRHDELPNNEVNLPEGMHWDTANEDDCRVVISRTNLPRTVKALSKLPSLTIKLEDGTPISWAFLGFDGSLVSLHCEEPYRRRGLAKALAAKLFRERTFDFGEDGWCSADVAPDNEGSRGMCKRLNGKPYWIVSWVLLHVAEVVPEKKTERPENS